jgi:predicted Zn-dependent peptidase
MDDVLDVVRTEMQRLADQGISDEELERGKGQLRGGLVLSMEESGTRMSRIAKAELLYDELPGIDEVIGRINAVTAQEVQLLAKELFAQPETLAVVGPSGTTG